MAGLSIYGRSQLLRAVFARDLFASSASWWIALTSMVPMAGDTGIHLLEPTDTAYARQPYGHTSAHWAETGLGTVGNAMQVTFPPPSVDWGLVAGWALVDSASGEGNLWLVGELITPARVIAGPDASVIIPPYAMQITGI